MRLPAFPLVPGSALGMSDRLLRFGLGRGDFVKGLERLDAFLNRRRGQ